MIQIEQPKNVNDIIFIEFTRSGCLHPFANLIVNNNVKSLPFKI